MVNFNLIKKLSLIILIINIKLYSYNIAIVGTGYVGLVTSAILSNLGHTVTCIDIDKEKINNINQNKLPIFEPELNEIISKNINKNLFFTTNIDQTIKNSKIIFITVGTPTLKNGLSDTTALYSVIKDIIKNTDNYKVVCIKSTVPIQTNTKVQEKISKAGKANLIDLVSNPEFLREGSAIKDFLEKNPIIIGSNSYKAMNILEKTYEPLIKSGINLIKTDPNTAELIKYSWNSYAAIKLAYINELDSLCKKHNANIFGIIKSLKYRDQLLPTEKITPGPGFGGSCFPKDTKAFTKTVKLLFNNQLNMVNASIKANKERKNNLIKRIAKTLNKIDKKTKTVSILGLSFKANTDDIRESFALNVIKYLMSEKNIKIKAFDPKAIENMKNIFPLVKYFDSVEKCIQDSDCIIILTEWDIIRNFDLNKISNFPQVKYIIDLRYLWNKFNFKKFNINYMN